VDQISILLVPAHFHRYRSRHRCITEPCYWVQPLNMSAIPTWTMPTIQGASGRPIICSVTLNGSVSV